MDEFSAVIAATSTTITFLVGVGIVGLMVFYAALYLMRNREGLWMATAFLLSNIINAGYNSSATLVTSALLLSLLAYQMRMAKSNRGMLISASPVRSESPTGGAAAVST
jgi:hypothetical protein